MIKGLNDIKTDMETENIEMELLMFKLLKKKK